MYFLRDHDNKVKLLFNDYVIKYDVCNFKCDYCLNNLKPKDTKIWVDTELKLTSINSKFEYFLYADNLREENVYHYDNELGVRINTMLDKSESILNTPILRISGGEIFSIKNIEEFIEQRGREYSVVQIVTNGYYLNEELIKRLKDYKNIHIHYSLDGHTLEMNRKRVKNQAVQQRLLDNLEILISYGINVEINSVMSNINTDNYLTFLDYLLKYRIKLVVFTTPIRGKDFKEHLPSIESYRVFDQIVNQYDKYKEILPPKKYYTYLAEFYKNDIRSEQCFLPEFAIQTLDDGVVTPCPLCWTKQLGNMFVENVQDINERIGKDRTYKLLWQKKIKLDICKQCYSTYEVCNLYFNNVLTIDEMRSIPLYSNPLVIKRLIEIKDNLGDKIL